MTTGLPFLEAGDVPDCSTVDPEVFFPPAGQGGSERTEQAKLICEGCPFLSECAEYSIQHDYLFGIWAGMSQRTRGDIRRQRGLPSLYRPLTLSRVIPGFDDDVEEAVA